MRVFCLQENLQKALILINRVVSQRTQLPVLSNVLISAKKNSLNLLATDLDLGVKIETPAKIEKEGEISIPAKLLLELVSTLPPEKIEIEVKETTLNLKTKRQSATFQGIPASEFPPFNNKGEDLILSIDGEVLKETIKSVVFAAATDDARPILNGVLLGNIKKNSGYFFVATDGYRLSLKRIEKKTGESKNITLIIPARVLKELSFLIDKEEGDSKRVDFFIVSQQNQIKFRVGNNLLFGRLIEGDFPDYEKIIPQNTNTRVLLEREDFLNSVKIASIFARESANIVKINIKKEGVMVSANAPQVGENQSFVEAIITGENNEIAFNNRFLLDFLASIEDREIIFEMTGPLNPGIFRIKNNDSLLHLIMPVRIQE